MRSRCKHAGPRWVVVRGGDRCLRHGLVVMKQSGQVSGVQMFSFLDAMVCTVGALLVLLHAFSHHGQVEAECKAKAKAAEQTGEDPKVALELVTWRIEQLREVRNKTEAQLADERLKLAHLEDHQRRLRKQAEQLTAELADLDRVQQTGETRTVRELAELEAARIRLVEARAAVERARQQNKRAASYSVVPYEGPHRTRRRPVYVECRQDLMVLQPEGIELTPGDFAGFLGAGNPLASAVRGAHEYYAAKSPADKPASEPYPLLLVRPDGIATYYAARRALDSWGADFGYELIGQDWNLKFSEPDFQLAELLQQIVYDARRRMRELMLATAELQASRPRMTLRASSSGGFVVERGPHSGGSGRSVYRGSSWDSLDSQWARGDYESGDDDADATRTGDEYAADRSGSNRLGTSAVGGMGSGDGPNRSATGADSTLVGDTARVGTGGSSSNGPYGGGALGGSGDRSGALADRKSNAWSGQRHGGDSVGTGDDAFGASAKHAGPSGSQNPSGDQLSDGPIVNEPYSDEHFAEGEFADGRMGNGQSGNTARSAEGGDATDTSSRFADQTGEPQGASPLGQATGHPPSILMSNQSGNGGACAVDSHAQQPSGAATHSSTSQQHSRKLASIASFRGRDWGLPDAGAGMTPVTRPIAVECHTDRLVILPEDRGQAPRVTRLDEDARANIDEFVSNVWRHMKGWGIAGRGLYWRPTLLVSVGPGAADRVAELEALLADSGLDVRLRRAQDDSTRTKRPSARPRRTH